MYKDKIIDLVKKYYTHYNEYFQYSLTDEPEWFEVIKIGLLSLEEKYASLLELIESRDSFSERLYDLFITTLLFDKNTNSFQVTYFPNSSESLNHKIHSLHQLYYLTIIDGDKNAVIIGGNGSGKSSLVSFFKSTLSVNISIIPARKNLFVNTDSSQFYSASKMDVQGVLQSRSVKQQDKYENYSDEFSKMIVALVNEYFNQINLDWNEGKGKEPDTINIFFQFKNLYQKLIPDIDFESPNNTEKTISPIKNGIVYTMNEMSDGERIIIYYIIQVLLAAENSTIIIDEPELYLNTSIYNRLWNELEAIRDDCRFIYVSHRIDFIESRLNSDFIWCKKYNHPDNWEIEILKDSQTENFPKDMLLELVGAKKNVIFCEGKTNSSVDYSLYSVLFSNYTVIPVENCDQVKRYVKAYNNQKSIFQNTALGIIDNDMRTDEEIEDLKKDKIFTTKFLEIEMLLCDEKVIIGVLTAQYDEDIAKKVELFKEKFFEKLTNKKDHLIQRWLKKIYERQLVDTHFNTKDDLSTNIQSLSTNLLALKSKEQSFSNYVDEILQTRDYNKWLEICTLEHNEILKGIADQVIDKNYKQKAQQLIKNDYDIQNFLRENYFSELPSLLD